MITLDEMFQIISENETVKIWVTDECADECAEFNNFELPLPLYQYKVKSFYSMITGASKYLDSCTHIIVTIIK